MSYDYIYIQDAYLSDTYTFICHYVCVYMHLWMCIRTYYVCIFVQCVHVLVSSNPRQSSVHVNFMTTSSTSAVITPLHMYSIYREE